MNYIMKIILVLVLGSAIAINLSSLPSSPNVHLIGTVGEKPYSINIYSSDTHPYFRVHNLVYRLDEYYGQSLLNVLNIYVDMGEKASTVSGTNLHYRRTRHMVTCRDVRIMFAFSYSTDSEPLMIMSVYQMTRPDPFLYKLTMD